MIIKSKINTLHGNKRPYKSISTRYLLLSLSYLFVIKARLHRDFYLYLPNMIGLRLRAIPLDKS